MSNTSTALHDQKSSSPTGCHPTPQDDGTPQRPAGQPDENPAADLGTLRMAGVCAVFFASGAASLICEVVWFKQLQIVLGSSISATSVVVASFFSGLALGSWICGRMTDQWRHLLRSYAWLEFTLAIASATATFILAHSEIWIGQIATWLSVNSVVRTPLMILVSMAILLPPTVLMGATLPVLTKYFVRRRSDLARRVGVLYGVNTLGAAAGCFLVGFVLIGHLGVIQSALIGSGIYLCIAGIAGLVALFSTSPVIGDQPSETSQWSGDGISTSAATGLVVVFGLMGFAAIAYEVLWFRILTNFSFQSVYAFAGMLSTYLLGLVIGAFVCAKFLAPQKDRLLIYFCRAQLCIAFTAAVSLVLLGRSHNVLLATESVLRFLGVGDWLYQATSGVGSFLLLAVIILLPPATMIGIGFPLASELTINQLGNLGSRLGILYGLNTLGGVLGSLVTGFILLPLLGSQASFLVILTLTLGLFAVTVATQPSLRVHPLLWREGLVTAVGLVAAFSYIGGNYLREAQTQFDAAEVLDFREEKDATFVVLEYDSQITQPYQQIIVNGKSYANNSPPGRRYMSALAHLPTLLHPHPKSAVVIAIGTGTTVGGLTLHPELEHISAVDISPSVFDFAPHFVPLNQDFMRSPKVQAVVDDGRHFLLCTDRRFDVLTFEPPPPHDAGIVNLYSQDFYRLARRRMTDNGIVCQWIPLDMPRGDLCRMLIKSMMKEFPHVSLWISNRCEGIAVGSTQPLSIDYQRLSHRMHQPALQADLAAYGLAEPEQLLATFVAADDDLAEFVADVPPVTDNRPYVEYFNLFPLRQLRFDDILAYRSPVEAFIVGTVPNPSRLDIAQQVTDDIWYAFELRTDGRIDEARQRLTHALRLDPQNEYLRYLMDAIGKAVDGV